MEGIGNNHYSTEIFLLLKLLRYDPNVKDLEYENEYDLTRAHTKRTYFE